MSCLPVCLGLQESWLKVGHAARDVACNWLYFPMIIFSDSSWSNGQSPPPPQKVS